VRLAREGEGRLEQVHEVLAAALAEGHPRRSNVRAGVISGSSDHGWCSYQPESAVGASESVPARRWRG
jgi:hypothetical protein